MNTSNVSDDYLCFINKERNKGRHDQRHDQSKLQAAMFISLEFCGLFARPTRVWRVLISPVTGHQARNIFEIIMSHKGFR